MAVVIVDANEKIRNFLPQLDELIAEGLVIVDPVEAIRYIGRGLIAGLGAGYAASSWRRSCSGGSNVVTMIPGRACPHPPVPMTPEVGGRACLVAERADRGASGKKLDVTGRCRLVTNLMCLASTSTP